MNLEKIKEALNKFLESEGLKLYDINYFKKDQILQVMLDEVLDLNHLEIISNKVSEFMDSIDEDMDKYLLDVTTVGAERPIRNLEEAKNAIGNYVYIKTKEFELNGELISIDDEVLTLSYKDKTRVKQKDINYKDIKQIRYAIKF